MHKKSWPASLWAHETLTLHYLGSALPPWFRGSPAMDYTYTSWQHNNLDRLLWTFGFYSFSSFFLFY